MTSCLKDFEYGIKSFKEMDLINGKSVEIGKLRRLKAITQDLRQLLDG
jgi:hypothetical protein